MLAVPSSSLSLCDALRQLETITWSELRAGYQCRQRLDEESVTSYHLMRLATGVAAIVLEKHHRGREARTGADWECWVGRPGSYMGFRVQAKILSPAKAEYTALYSSRTKALVQIDKLIAAAALHSPPTYPLYAFYNYWLSGSWRVPQWPCPRASTDPRCAGWTVASAHDIRTHLASWRPSKKLWDMSQMMFPISCLFCCQCNHESTTPPGLTLAESVARRVTNRWGEGPSPLVVERAPVYVERMFKGERAEDGWTNVSSFFRPRARELPPHVSRVLLIRDLTEAA